jgi:hypothetical protein
MVVTERIVDRGVVLLFCGIGYAERIAVALHTLRQHWTGPVSLYVTDDDCEGIGRRLGKDLDIDVDRREITRHRRHSAYCAKPLVPSWSPYERTVYLDGDTITVSGIDPLFDYPLTITHFAQWVSTGGIMSGRIRRWRGISPAIDRLVAAQLDQPHPAINTGVFAWHRSALPELAAWAEVTTAGRDRPLTDEISMQVLHPVLSARVVGDEWNCSPLYGVAKRKAKIWHFHGKKHVRRDAGRVLWWPAFEAARAANVGGLAEWAGTWDGQVKGALGEG